MPGFANASLNASKTSGLNCSSASNVTTKSAPDSTGVCEARVESAFVSAVSFQLENDGTGVARDLRGFILRAIAHDQRHTVGSDALNDPCNCLGFVQGRN